MALAPKKSIRPKANPIKNSASATYKSSMMDNMKKGAAKQIAAEAVGKKKKK